MPTLAEVLQELEQDGVRLSDEQRSRLEEAAVPKFYRDQIDELSAQAKRVPDLEGKVARLERAPEAKQAFKQAGVDLEKTAPKILELIEGFEDYQNPEKVSEFVKSYGVPMLPAGEQPRPATTAAEGIVNETTSAGTVTEPPPVGDAATVQSFKDAKSPAEAIQRMRDAGLNVVNG